MSGWEAMQQGSPDPFFPETERTPTAESQYGTSVPAGWKLVGPDPQLGEPWLLFIRNGGTEYYDRRIERRRDENDGA